MEWILCRVVESSCLPTHNIVPHISSHDLPYRRTMKKYEDFEGMVISLLHPQKSAIRTWFSNCLQYLCLFDKLVECNPSKRGQKINVGSPKSTSFMSSFHIRSMSYFTLSLSASQVYMIKERCWFSQIDFFIQYFPHRINVLFLSSQFHVIHIHR